MIGRTLSHYEIKAKLGSGAVTPAEEPIYAGANGALKIAHDMPEDYWEFRLTEVVPQPRYHRQLSKTDLAVQTWTIGR